jgi:hypothetical protein
LFSEIRLGPSISDYYVLRTRDAFVVVLFTIGLFLFTYRGYDERDDIAGNLARLFALGVASFPNGGSRGPHAYQALIPVRQLRHGDGHFIGTRLDPPIFAPSPCRTFGLPTGTARGTVVLAVAGTVAAQSHVGTVTLLAGRA